MLATNPASATVRDRYIRFADIEAHGRSHLYEVLARGVADDAEVINFLLSLPSAKQQPNLLFAAVRCLFGTPEDFEDFKHRLVSNSEAVRAVMLERSTQTNEPARCATLLPILANLPQPLAIIEVGASAGLCLLLDFYGYNYDSCVIRPDTGVESFPVFSCKASSETPLPMRMPQIVWRAGLDLNPLDAADRDQSYWLETLVWPEQHRRLAGLRGALQVAAAQRPRLVQGSLTGDALPLLCQEAPKDATLIVFHTAVLAYVAEHAERQAFADTVTSLCPYWICNEAPRVMPAIAAHAGEPSQTDRFLLSVNGSPVAWTEPHGAAIDWIANPKLL
ncbi:MAG: DUF2332 domain-containing protein [Caulobacteraceae bacterium]